MRTREERDSLTSGRGPNISRPQSAAPLDNDHERVWVVHRGGEVARYPRSYEHGVWLPPPIMRPEPPAAAAPLVLPRLEVAPPELADYAELCA
jgi:hypothetical protein